MQTGQWVGGGGGMRMGSGCRMSEKCFLLISFLFVIQNVPGIVFVDVYKTFPDVSKERSRVEDVRVEGIRRSREGPEGVGVQ